MSSTPSTLISTDRFQFYADYFALASTAGIESASTFFPVVASVVSVDIKTYAYFEEAFVSKNALVGNLRSSYEQIFSNALSLEPMRDAFVSLSDHIKEFTGGSVDEYLTLNDIKVDGVYARISNLTGNIITSGNIT